MIKNAYIAASDGILDDFSRKDFADARREQPEKNNKFYIFDYVNGVRLKILIIQSIKPGVWQIMGYPWGGRIDPSRHLWAEKYPTWTALVESGKD
jgi:hypothetical protein